VRQLRAESPTDTPGAEVLAHVARREWLSITCNRDDFLKLASVQTHADIIILIRRRSRVAERAALLRLLERAGLEGLAGNINFA
jgi:hypothetical protein